LGIEGRCERQQVTTQRASVREAGRGDATSSRSENRKKFRLIAGVISALPQHPDLTAIVQDQLVAPRTAQMRDLFERAAARGEIAPGRNLDAMALVAPALTVYWLMIENKPLDRAFYTVLVRFCFLCPQVNRRASDT